MFEKPWKPVKNLLLGSVCLMTLLAPYESEAAPKNRGRSERLSKRARREAERRNRRQSESRGKRRTTPRPTFEERFSPAQVNRKIQTIRRRIETAPENVFPAKDKRIFLEVFDDMVQTPMGRYIFEKAHPDLTFRVRQTGEGVNGSYSYGDRCVNLGRRIFDDIHNATTPVKKLYEKLYIAHVIAHETTHSIQHVNNMNNRSNMSVEEAVTIHKLLELNAILNQTIVRYQIGNLPKYRHMIPDKAYPSEAEAEPGKVYLVPMHFFFKELKEAKMADGADEKTAERFARTKFAEAFWQNNGQTPIRVGSRTVLPTSSNTDEVMRNWNATYTGTGFERRLGDNRPYRQKMTDVSINRNIQRFIDAMGIDTQPSFFRDPKTASFNIPISTRIVGYADGIRALEMDALTTGVVTKVYHQGRLFRIVFETTKKQKASKDGTYTEYHEGTRTRSATYTYRNGKMNGVYREYDSRGQQIMEVPVVDDKSEGEGWVLENGIRARKRFHPRGVSHIRERD